MEFTAELIAGFLQGDIVGDPKATVSELSKIEEGHPGSLAFLSNPKYEHYIYQTQATIVIVNRSFEPTAPVSATMIKVDDAYSCFAKLLELYIANKPQKQGVSKLAAIHESAEMGEEVYVGDYGKIPDVVLFHFLSSSAKSSALSASSRSLAASSASSPRLSQNK